MCVGGGGVANNKWLSVAEMPIDGDRCSPSLSLSSSFLCFRLVHDVWQTNVWDLQAKSGTEVFFGGPLALDLLAGLPETYINSVHTRCIVKTGGFTRSVCKNRGFY